MGGGGGWWNGIGMRGKERERWKEKRWERKKEKGAQWIQSSIMGDRIGSEPTSSSSSSILGRCSRPRCRSCRSDAPIWSWQSKIPDLITTEIHLSKCRGYFTSRIRLGEGTGYKGWWRCTTPEDVRSRWRDRSQGVRFWISRFQTMHLGFDFTVPGDTYKGEPNLTFYRYSNIASESNPSKLCPKRSS